MAKKHAHEEASRLAGELFGLILDRNADEGGYGHVLYCLESGKKSIRELVYEFMTSDEFIARFLTDSGPAAAVILVQRILLGRSPETVAELQDVQREFIRIGLARFVRNILMSEEYELDTGPNQVPPYGH
ncbi:MAG: phycobilisome rod-core linker polypeptide [Rhizomicrobium sp.]|jgi:hypothetical protein